MQVEMVQVLLAEDDTELCSLMADYFAPHGFSVDAVHNGREALRRALQGGFDLLILDWMLPKKSGLDVCRELRQNSVDVPVIMLTARGELVDKVVGLQIGADDYVTKPFEMMELTARIGALLRRVPSRAGTGPGVVQFGNVRVDFRKAEVSRSGHPVVLSAREFQLLRYLAERRGDTFCVSP